MKKNLLIILFFTAFYLNSVSASFNDILKQNKIWQENRPLKLHLGCGESHLAGYINIDYPSTEHTVQATSAADVFADITTLSILNESVDEIRSHHVFEHFDRQTALALLCNWHQQLKVGGTLIIETPDFKESSLLLLLDTSLSYKDQQAILRHIFGSHEARWAIHCDGWYKEKFLHVLSLLGYEDICIEHSRYLNLCNITITAKKLKPSNNTALLETAKAILRESLVADCETKMYSVWCEQFEKLVL